MRADKPPVLRPVEPTRKLFHETAERIAAEIISAKLPPGARLPTEQQMAAAMGVSRTVVREAVAALRADGVVTTRQGGRFSRRSNLAIRQWRAKQCASTSRTAKPATAASPKTPRAQSTTRFEARNEKDSGSGG